MVILLEIHEMGDKFLVSLSPFADKMHQRRVNSQRCSGREINSVTFLGHRSADCPNVGYHSTVSDCPHNKSWDLSAFLSLSYEGPEARLRWVEWCLRIIEVDWPISLHVAVTYTPNLVI